MTLWIPSRLSAGLATGTRWSAGPICFETHVDNVLGSTKHPFSISTYLDSLFSTSVRTYASSRGPATKRTKKTELRDEWAVNHAKQRKAANLARRAALQELRAKQMGDPIRGITTPFIESLDSAIPQEVQPTLNILSNKPESAESNKSPPSPAHAANEDHLNYYLSKPEVEEALRFSKSMTEPIVQPDREIADPYREKLEAEEHAARDRSAQEAVNRIVSLSNTSSSERSRVNVRRIINTFGRHNTDQYLRPKAASQAVRNASSRPFEATPRAGPDTGSSEVQIGILTAKIRILADRHEGENRNDKVNKRNLRLLLHRRQKLLKYMEKKERGSDRWQNMISTLGLTEATWKGEIAVK